jgi:hypothetical protein
MSQSENGHERGVSLANGERGTAVRVRIDGPHARFRLQHRQLVERRERLRNPHATTPPWPTRGEKGVSLVAPDSDTEAPQIYPWNARLRRDKPAVIDVTQFDTVEAVDEALFDLYERAHATFCDDDAQYRDQIMTLQEALAWDIRSDWLADIVGCSTGHARRFPYDYDDGECSEADWAERRREHKMNPRVRADVRERDDDECVRCGATEDLVTHHIRPVCAGGDGVPENLATLCERCHEVAHGSRPATGDVVYDSVEGFWRWAEVSSPGEDA